MDVSPTGDPPGLGIHSVLDPTVFQVAALAGGRPQLGLTVQRRRGHQQSAAHVDRTARAPARESVLWWLWCSCCSASSPLHVHPVRPSAQAPRRGPQDPGSRHRAQVVGRCATTRRLPTRRFPCRPRARPRPRNTWVFAHLLPKRIGHAPAHAHSCTTHKTAPTPRPRVESWQ